MVSNNDYSTDGKSSHRNTGSKGSVSTVRVGSRSLPMYPLIIVCLGLLNVILLLTAVVLGIYCDQVGDQTESPPYQITTDTLLVEVKQLQTIHSEVIEAQKEAQQAVVKERRNHQQMKLHLEKNRSLCDSLQWQLEKLHVERAMLKANTSDIMANCGRCMSGFFLLNTSCYFHAKSESNILKDWTDSRADCISRGADLAVIDNWDEQVNLFEYLPKLSRSGGFLRADKIWIGLTDIQEEGIWVWVNNVSLDKGYWMYGEPNNNNGLQGEDCAALSNGGNPKTTWTDLNCKTTREWLCEREPN